MITFSTVAASTPSNRRPSAGERRNSRLRFVAAAWLKPVSTTKVRFGIADEPHEVIHARAGFVRIAADEVLRALARDRRVADREDFVRRRVRHGRWSWLVRSTRLVALLARRQRLEVLHNLGVVRLAAELLLRLRPDVRARFEQVRPARRVECATSSASRRSFAISPSAKPELNVRGSTLLGNFESVPVLRPVEALKMSIMVAGSSPKRCPAMTASAATARFAADRKLFIDFMACPVPGAAGDEHLAHGLEQRPQRSPPARARRPP